MRSYIETNVRKIGLGIVSFILVLSILSCLKIFSCMIPDVNVQTNLEKSISLINGEGDYPQNFINCPDAAYYYAGYRLDTVTEYAIMSTVYTSSNKTPIKNAFANMGSIVGNSEEMINYIQSKGESARDRMQYWMGLTVIERIAFNFVDYAMYREIMIIIFVLLYMITFYNLSHKFNFKVALSFVISSVCVNLWVVMFSPNFCITFILAFIFMNITIYFYKRWKHRYIFMMIVGMLTSFFDWMSTPLVTFGLTVIVIMIIECMDNVKIIEGLRLIVGNGIVWCVGYVGMIVSKWAVSSIVLHTNAFKIGFERVVAGTSVKIEGDPDGFIPMVIMSIKNNVLSLSPIDQQITSTKKYLLFFVVAIALVSIVAFHRNWKECSKSLIFLVIGITPYAWFTMFKGHCHIHYWFTYRIQIVAIMSFVIAIMMVIDTNKIRKCIFRKVNDKNSVS